MQDYTKALGRTKETIKDMLALEASLTGLANVGMTVPKDGAVVVPHGSALVSHEDVNWTSTVMKCGQWTRMRSETVTETIIGRRSEYSIAAIGAVERTSNGA